MPASSVKCLEDAFFPPTRVARFLRWARQQRANICDLDEESYEQLIGQRNIRINLVPIRALATITSPASAAASTVVAVGEPKAPEDCPRMLEATRRFNAIRASMQLVLASLAVPAALARHARNPLRLVTLRFSNSFVNAAANTAIRLALAAYSPTAVALMALEGLALFLQLMPRYVSHEDCMDRHGMHPVPARFRLCGHFVAALIFGPISYALMYLSNMDAHAEVAKVLRVSFEQIGSADKTKAIVEACFLTSFFATLSGTAKISAGIFITDMLFNVVFYFMRLLGESMKTSRVGGAVKMLLGAVIVFHGRQNGETFDKTDFFEDINWSIENINTPTSFLSTETRRISENLQTFIRDAIKDTVEMLYGVKDAKVPSFFSIVGKVSDNVRSGSQRYNTAFADTSKTLTGIFEELRRAEGAEITAVVAERLPHLIPEGLITTIFSGGLLYLVEKLGCRLAKSFYDHSQRKRHLHHHHQHHDRPPPPPHNG